MFLLSGCVMECISYKDGYKYQLVEPYLLKINIIPEQDVDTDYIALTTEGQLTVKKGYAWDGPSGPSIDTKSFMRGSLVHDALYQLMRNDYLNHEVNRKAADQLLHEICRKDGMNFVRAWFVRKAVRMFGNPAADPASKKPVIKAPKSCG